MECALVNDVDVNDVPTWDDYTHSRNSKEGEKGGGRGRAQGEGSGALGPLDDPPDLNFFGPLVNERRGSEREREKKKGPTSLPGG